MSSITIAIPIYNVRDYVERSIMSAVNQTFSDIEIILIDDKGSDDSMEIAIRLLSTQTKPILWRVIEHACNKGLGEARNSAVRECRSEFLFFMDSDDEIPSDCIELLYNAMQKEEGLDFACGKFASVINNDKSNIKSIDRDAVILHGVKDNVVVGRGTGILSGSECNKLYRVNFLKQNNITNITRIGEDHFWCLQEMAFANKIICIPQVTYYYHLREGSITNGYNTSSFPLKLVESLYKNLFDSVEFVSSLNIKDRTYLEYVLLGYLFLLPQQLINSKTPDAEEKIRRLFSDQKVRELLCGVKDRVNMKLPLRRDIAYRAFKIPGYMTYPFWKTIISVENLMMKR